MICNQLEQTMALSEEEFEAFVAELQEKSFAEARAVYGKKGFQRWRNPRFNGVMEDADSSACIKGSCGDVIEIFLKFHQHRVEKVSYRTSGCGSSALCGSFTAELAIGKRLEEIMTITPALVLQEIGRFPAADKHCATLAVMALHKALNEYLRKIVPDERLQALKNPAAG